MDSEVAQGFLKPYDSWKNRIATLRFVEDIPLSPKDYSWQTILKIEEKLSLFKDTPMLIAWGGKDFCFNDHFYKEWQRRFPQADCHYFEDAGKKLVQLMSHRKASIRLRVVQSLWTDTPPREITDSIIRCGLMDKSISVRQFAADRIGQFQLNYFVPQLRELLKNEQNKKVITAAQYTLRRLEKATP